MVYFANILAYPHRIYVGEIQKNLRAIYRPLTDAVARLVLQAMTKAERDALDDSSVVAPWISKDLISALMQYPDPDRHPTIAARIQQNSLEVQPEALSA